MVINQAVNSFQTARKINNAKQNRKQIERKQNKKTLSGGSERVSNKMYSCQRTSEG